MKVIGLVSTGILSLLLGVSTVVCAQEPEKNQEEKPSRQEAPRPEPKQDEAKPRKEEVKPPNQDENKPPREAKPPKHEESNAPEQSTPGAKEHPEQQAKHGRPAGKSVHIPDDKFRAQFGRAHTVVINRPVIVEGQPRFPSGGYWFVIVDPWPVDWAYSDDCYIDYVDGDYFLFDLLHPGVRIALFVTM